MTSTEASPQAPTRGARMRALVARATAMEKVVYTSIARAIARRPAVPAGARGFRFHAPVLTILWIFIALSAVELVVIDLIVHRWVIVRIVCLVIGVWGLMWMIGALCSYHMRPHTVGPEGIEIRNGFDLSVRIGWDDVHSVAIATHTYEPKTPNVVDVGGDRRALVVGILHETNIEIVLERPTSITLPGLPPKGGEHAVEVARLWADDPKAFLAGVGEHL
ncbi:hypothetical protein [Microbacterium sp. No. 7]|uniref:hypothetical protein n=1 Tax=Microbacterium sp. No. 7 TaxID=1714373 RepID=UPI0006D0DB92|nr:hypothetical protein [Microbacterium sp. No. 7]ALJ20867.1 hypothetical protein AOA12_13515 [Microbacterium sp. No. 7]